jgi:hypothetical protein
MIKPFKLDVFAVNYKLAGEGLSVIWVRVTAIMEMHGLYILLSYFEKTDTLNEPIK